MATDGWRTSPERVPSQREAMRMSVTVYSRAGRFNPPRRARDVRIAVSERRWLCATDNAIHVDTEEEGSDLHW